MSALASWPRARAMAAAGPLTRATAVARLSSTAFRKASACAAERLAGRAGATYGASLSQMITGMRSAGSARSSRSASAGWRRACGPVTAAASLARSADWSTSWPLASRVTAWIAPDVRSSTFTSSAVLPCAGYSAVLEPSTSRFPVPWPVLRPTISRAAAALSVEGAATTGACATVVSTARSPTVTRARRPRRRETADRRARLFEGPNVVIIQPPGSWGPRGSRSAPPLRVAP